MRRRTNYAQYGGLGVELTNCVGGGIDVRSTLTSVGAWWVRPKTGGMLTSDEGVQGTFM